LRKLSVFRRRRIAPFPALRSPVKKRKKPTSQNAGSASAVKAPTWGKRRQFNGGNFRKISHERAAPTVKVDATVPF
jgi:hypothetical protein